MEETKDEISSKVSNSSKDITPQANNVQNEIQLEWEGTDPSKSFDWETEKLNISDKQNNIIQQNT